MSSTISTNILIGGAAALSTVALAAYYLGKKVGSHRTIQDFSYKPWIQPPALKQFLEYIDEYSTPEPEIMDEMREWSDRLGFLGRETPKHQTSFMSMLVQLTETKKILEVGTFTGVATLSFALALPEDGKVTTLEFDQEFIDHGKVMWDKSGVGHKITAICDDGAKVMDEMIRAGEAGTWDMVFIDADKWNHHKYFTRAVTLVKKGGVILIDDTLLEGLACDPKYNNDGDTSQLCSKMCYPSDETSARDRKYTENVAVFVHQLNKKVVKDSRVHMALVPIANGITVAIKK